MKSSVLGSLWLGWLGEAYRLADRLDDARERAQRALEISRERKKPANARWKWPLIARPTPQGSDAGWSDRAGARRACPGTGSAPDRSRTRGGPVPVPPPAPAPRVAAPFPAVDRGQDLGEVGIRIGASPSVGSSTSITRGRATRARAMASICCSPPESCRPRWPIRSRQAGKLSKTSSTRAAFCSPRRSTPTQPRRRFSSTVRFGSTRRSSGTQAMPRRTIAMGGQPRDVLALHADRALPGRDEAEMERSVVVLPAPLRPMRVTHCPRLHGQRDALEDVGLPVVGVNVLEREQRHRMAPR